MLEFLLPPFIASLILVGIHAYLGIHVLERKVIFVDLALAQIAALGATTAFVLGFELHSNATYLMSLGFTFIGAAVFSLTRTRHEVVPQEAIIGIAYAVAAAATVLLMDRAAEGAEQIKNMLVGSILFVTWDDIIKISILYGIIGLFHYIFRAKFIIISTNPEAAYQQGIHVRRWDFLFYTSFGFVVTSSVDLAGVLQVFSYLIVPSVCAALLAKSLRNRLLIGWLLGFLASFLGIFFSVQFDFPTGASIVCTFGLILAIIWIYHRLRVRYGNNPEPVKSL